MTKDEEPSSVTTPTESPSDSHTSYPSRRLTRRTDEAWLSGVAAGMGAHFGIDPVIFRVMFVVLGLVGGVGVLFYFAIMLLVPPASIEEEAMQPIVHTIDLGPFTRRDFYRKWGAPFAIVIALVSVIELAHTLRLGHGGVTLPIIILGVGGFLLSDRSWHRPFRVASSGPTVINNATSKSAEVHPPDFGALVRQREIEREQSRLEKVERKRNRAVRTLTIGAMFLVVGTTVLLDRANTLHASLGQILSAALITLGIGLLIATWFGRARGLVFLGILLLPFTVAASAVNVPLGGGTGTRMIVPVSATDIRRNYQLGAGRIRLDLHKVVIPAGTTKNVRVTVGAGLLEVVVPDNTLIKVRGAAAGGQVTLLGRMNDGTTVRLNNTVSPDGSVGVLLLDAEVGFGKVNVFRFVPSERMVTLEPVIKPVPPMEIVK